MGGLLQNIMPFSNMCVQTGFPTEGKQLYRIVTRNGYTGLTFINNQYGNTYIANIGNDPNDDTQMQVISLSSHSGCEKFYKDDQNNMYLEIDAYNPNIISSLNNKIKIEAVDVTDSIQTSSLTEIKIQKVSIINE